jgi:hypothetical protein
MQTEAPQSESLVQAQVEAPVEQQAVEPQAEPVSDRPEWLPEKFNDPADLGKAYKALESKLGEKEEDVRQRLMEELNAQAAEGVPATAGEYELPDSLDSEEALENEMLQQWAEHCHSNGYTHDEFKKGIEMYMQGMGTGPDLAAEAGRLGDNSNARIEAANLFANQFFPEETMPAIERMCESAEGIMALEAIMSALKEPSLSDQANISANANEAELQEMMKDERYWNPSRRDSNWIKQVDEGFKKLYG